MLPTRIGVVRFLNTAPLNYGLEKLEGLELIPAAPSSIAGMILQGQIDIGLASIIDAARHADHLTLLPVGMIGCDGPTLTVRIFSRVSIERIRTVHADTDSHTSVALCQVVLHRLTGARPEIVDFDATAYHAARARGSGSAPLPGDTVLLIGDKVVTDAPPPGEYPHELDLGEAWKSITGLPFVYAMWMCRAAEAGSEKVVRAAALLDRQLRHNLTRMGSIVGARAALHSWPEALAAKYLGELLRYRVGDREREAAEAFIRAAGELGLAGAGGPRLNWAGEVTPVRM